MGITRILDRYEDGYKFFIPAGDGDDKNKQGQGMLYPAPSPSVDIPRLRSHTLENPDVSE